MQWGLVRRASTTLSATNERSSPSASIAIWTPICARASPGWKRSLPPRQAIETFLTEIVERSLESRLGCLLANAALEVAPHDPEIAAVVAERMGELEAFFRRCVIAGQRDGSISPGVDPADAGRLLLTTVMGLRVLARGFPNRAVLEGAARQALSVLGKHIRRRKPPSARK